MSTEPTADLAPYTGCRDPFTLAAREPSPVGGIDREQLFQAVVYCEATEPYLYGRFCRDTPPEIHYRVGSRPVLEGIVGEVVTAGMTNAGKAIALGGYVYEHAPHPLLHHGEQAPKARGWTEEQLLEDGRAWCNEQTRIFVCLCQVAGIPARMVAIFHSNRKTGHVVSEFWTGEKWALFDPTYNVIVEISPGRHASAAEIRNSVSVAAMADEVYRPAVASFAARVSKDQVDSYRPVAYDFDISPSRQKFAGLSFWNYDIL